mmetsp:Transcript_24703/g.51684  ORF Transcript_24703/g.51684 Transcript_24703/m.51684 type:complete len:1337 (+) Transcript_24703:117-4127(+)
MGKRRNRKNRKKQQVWRQFRSRSIVQAVEDETERERYKEEQKAHLKNIAESKLDLLCRTVLVGSVLPLGVEKNKNALRVFMERNYGPVQKLGVDKKRKCKFPRGRVTFNFKQDAEKIFGGITLLDASKERIQVKIPCASVGFKGSIAVWPSSEYKGMMLEDLNTSSVIQVNAEDLSLGHWFPSGADSCFKLPGLEEMEEKDQAGTWVEENPTKLNPVMFIDMEKGVIELDVTHCVQSALGDTLLHLLGAAEREKIIISFRFKDLAHPMQLCRFKRGWLTANRFCLCLSLKHPPRLSYIVTNLETDWETRTRLTKIVDSGGCALLSGTCLGYCLELSGVEISRLAKESNKLKKCGLFLCEEGPDLSQQAELIPREQVDYRHRKKLVDKIASVAQPRVELFLRSIVDSQSCSWFDMLNDKVKGRDLFDLVKEGENDLVERVLSEMREMHGKTRYPAQMFHQLYVAGVEVDEVPRPVPNFCVSLPRLLITPCRMCVTGFEVEMSNRLVRKFIEQFGFSDEAFIRVSIGDENGDKLFSDDLSGQVEARIKELVLNGISLVKKKYLFLAYSSSQLKEQSMWMVCPENRWNVIEMRKSMGDFSMCRTPAKYAARIGQCFSTTIDTSFVGLNSKDTGGFMNWTKQKFGFHRQRSNEFNNSKTLRVNDDLPDITSYNTSTGETMEHSDGVGLIRKERLKDIVKEITFGPKYKDDVTAIQIRYGGAKGVLMAWDFANLTHQRCSGYDVCLRPSMVKFKAPYDRLEVINIANRIPYFLNRNVILLGSHHSINDEIFLEIQAHHVYSLNKMLVDANFAAIFLPRLSGPDSGLMSTLSHMLYANLKPDIDPFLYSCLHATRAHHLMNLRKKSRIYVEDGAVLIGGIDELGLIPEGCVFLQVQRPLTRKAGSQKDINYMVIEGPVMVTKHPVMHPGDMRMLLAVNIPKLRDHKNVLLFSQHGERPEADKMSGSDLDGDQFAVTWDDRLFLRNPSSPMDYAPPKKPSDSDSITDGSLVEHFINHARNDNLGRISMLWMDHAVMKKDAGCSECLELAKLASIAVDFPKSGVPASIRRELIISRSTPRAHWRERKGSPTFHCQSVVGQLYDMIIDEMKSQRRAPQSECMAMAGRYRDKNGQILNLGDTHRIAKSKERIYNPMLPTRLGWTGDELDGLLINYAEHERDMYESQLLELMNQYKVKSEGEVATGCILKYHKLHKRRRHDVSEDIRRQFRGIRKVFRTNFFTAVYHLAHGNRAFLDAEMDDNEHEDDVTDENLDWVEAVATDTALNSVGEEMSLKSRRLSCRLAAAYYITAYSPEMHAADSRQVFYSFPWVVAADVISRGVNEGSD